MCCPNPEAAKIVLPMSYRIEKIEKNAGTRGVKEREENSIGLVQESFWGQHKDTFSAMEHDCSTSSSSCLV